MVIVLGFHGTPKTNLGSIMRWGLKARLTHEHNYPDMVDQPRGVYLIAASVWSSWEWGVIDQSNDECRTVVVDITGLPLRKDPEGGPLAFYSPTDIPPDRLRILDSEETYWITGGSTRPLD